MDQKQELVSSETLNSRLYKVGNNIPVKRSDIGGIIASMNPAILSQNERVHPEELEKIQERTLLYLSHCESYNNLPTMQGLAGWLGINRKTLYEWLKDSRKPKTVDLLERIRDLIVDISTQAATKGKINPVTWIFYAKNYFEMQDSVELSVGATNNVFDAQKSREELERQYSANDSIED